MVGFGNLSRCDTHARIGEDVPNRRGGKPFTLKSPERETATGLFWVGKEGKMRRHESRLFKPGERITVDDVTRILKDAGPVDDVEGIQILKELNGYRRVDVIVSLKARE